MRSFHAAALVAATLALGACSVRDAPSDPVTVTADIPAAGIQHLVFNSTAGEAKIGVSPDDAVHVKLTLQQEVRRLVGISLPSEATFKDMEAAKVSQGRQGDTLTLSTGFPSGEDHNSDVKQEWVVQVPARLSVDATMKEGRLVIDGVSGGVKTQLSAGETIIHIPSGPIQAHMSAGRLHVITDIVEPHDVTVNSTFGLAVLSVHGVYYGPPPTNDSFHFFGNDVTQQGTGKDDIDLSVTAGLADLRVGVLGDKEVRREIFTEDSH